MAARADRIRLDLNSPRFQEVFLALDAADLKQVVAGLRRLSALDWGSLHQHPGFRWEAIDHIPTPTGAKAHSLRLSQKIRVLAYRDGAFLRIISLHADHDSAYRR